MVIKKCTLLFFAGITAGTTAWGMETAHQYEVAAETASAARGLAPSPIEKYRNLLPIMEAEIQEYSTNPATTNNQPAQRLIQQLKEHRSVIAMYVNNANPTDSAPLTAWVNQLEDYCKSYRAKLEKLKNCLNKEQQAQPAAATTITTTTAQNINNQQNMQEDIIEFCCKPMLGYLDDMKYFKGLADNNQNALSKLASLEQQARITQALAITYLNNRDQKLLAVIATGYEYFKQQLAQVSRLLETEQAPAATAPAPTTTTTTTETAAPATTTTTTTTATVESLTASQNSATHAAFELSTSAPRAFTSIPLLSRAPVSRKQAIYNLFWPSMPTLVVEKKQLDQRVDITVLGLKVQCSQSHGNNMHLITEIAAARGWRLGLLSAVGIWACAQQALSYARFIHANTLAIPVALAGYAITKPIFSRINRKNLVQQTNDDFANGEIRTQYLKSLKPLGLNI